MNPPSLPAESEMSAAARHMMRHATADAIAAHQVTRLNRLLAAVLPHNRFYAEKFDCQSLRISALEDLRQLPLLRKSEIDTGDGTPARFHSFDPSAYCRFHRTSGTHGHPMPVMDTRDDWQWWIDTWQYVLDAGEVTSADVALMAFSFGPFIGFWSANDALAARGAMVIPAGGMSTRARLALIEQSRATVLCCTPTYALHLAETAAAEGLEPRHWPVRLIIVAGEPGGSVPEVRSRMESAWDARVLDHSGATELGPWGFGSRDGKGLHIIESEFVAELLVPGTDRPAGEGELAELVLTGLGRFGAPAIRYQTGDLVRAHRDHDDQCRFLWLDGGVIGRADDMMVVRGVNIFPTSIERIVRSFPRIGEFRMIAARNGQMDELQVIVEDPTMEPRDLEAAMEQRLGLRISIAAVAVGSLPRFEAKARRFEDRRRASGGEA